MYGNHFYNETTRRYVAVFGTMFNDIKITRKDELLSKTKTMKVPINYAPMEKVLARVGQNLKNNAPAITLPRMSFEMTGMTYAPDRKLTSTTKLSKVTESGGTMSTRYAPSPYDIEFQLNIMTKYNEDGTKIIEQILPFFKPDCTVSVKLLDELDTYFDIPIVLNSVSQEDTYEGDFESRRALIWTLNFTMKGYFFGPSSTKKQIAFTDVDIAPVPELGLGQPGAQEASQVSATPFKPITPITVAVNDQQEYEYIHHLTPGKQYRIYKIGQAVGADDDPSFENEWEKGWNQYLTGHFNGMGQTLVQDHADSNPTHNPGPYVVGLVFTAPDLDLYLDRSTPETIAIGESYRSYGGWNQIGLPLFGQRMQTAKVVELETDDFRDNYDPETDGEVELSIDDDWKYRTIVT